MSQFSASGQGTQSRFLKMEAGSSMNLRFVDMLEKVDVPNQFTNADGSYGEWRFVDLETDSEKLYTHKSSKNGISIALAQAGIKEGDAFKLTRTGTGPETRYTAEKLESLDLLKAMNPSEEAPF